MVNFRKSLFGYSRIDVLNYINMMSEKYSASLKNKDLENEEKLYLLTKKIEQLEAENEEMKTDLSKIASIFSKSEQPEDMIHKEFEILKEKVNTTLLAFEDELDKIHSIHSVSVF